MAAPNRWTDALDQVLTLVVLLDDDMERALAHVRLTAPRAHLLWQLLHHGPSTQRAIAEAMCVSARNITGLVDGLVATGFVTREPHPTDRRATLVSFTRHGETVAQRLREDQREFARLLFGGMPAQQLDGFTDGLGQVMTRLHELGVASGE